jgi:hypothetical protein
MGREFLLPLSHTALKNVVLLAALLNDRSYAEITA